MQWPTEICTPAYLYCISVYLNSYLTIFLRIGPSTCPSLSLYLSLSIYWFTGSLSSYPATHQAITVSFYLHSYLAASSFPSIYLSTFELTPPSPPICHFLSQYSSSFIALFPARSYLPIRGSIG